MSEDASKALVREFFKAIDAGNLTIVRELLSADFVLRAPALPNPWGIEELVHDIREFYTAFPNSAHVIDDLIAEEDRVAVRLNVYGTHEAEFQGMPATGREIRIAGTHVLRIEGDKIREFWALEDTLGWMQQLGMELTPKQA